MAINKAKLSKLVLKAFSQLGDLRKTVTFQRMVPGEYDPTTGNVSSTRTEYTLRNVLFTSLSSAEVSWFPADRNTQKMLIEPSGLPSAPTTTDVVVVDDTTWEIIRVKRAPSDLLYTVYIMEP